MTVHFKVTLSGSGKNIDECWDDAVEGFNDNPGVTPGEGEYEIVEKHPWDEENEEH